MPTRSEVFVSWTRKLHVYISLFLLAATWLFAFSGLLLNHSWKFTEFWEKRVQSTNEHKIVFPASGPALSRASNIMTQLSLAGELESVRLQGQGDRLDFRVVRPGRITEVRADPGNQSATVRTIRVNGWGVIRMLHTFTGLERSSPPAERDWIHTRLWAGCMDVVAIGFILFVLSGFILAFARRERRLGVAVALGLGLLACGFFVFGLHWL